MKAAGKPADALALDPRRCWRAVLARDARWDERFVYAVRSTRIYCRPSCPARRPRRMQVLFFALPEAAERSGFRPCRRCQAQAPARDPSGKLAASPQAELVGRVCRHIEAGLDGALTLEALAAAARTSPHWLQRTFQRVMGITPRQYADALRLRRLKKRLRKGDDVTTALYEAGYSSSSRLYERSDAQLGMTPATYRLGGYGMRIGYTIVNSPLGRLLVAATRRGVSAVYLGDSDQALETALREEYPRAQIHRDTNGLSTWVRALRLHLRGRQPRLDLPLDVQATAFQRRVWEALRAIPYGSTRSYSQIARTLGRPKATRAVARACATNPVSVVVPCHRVVRQDGGLGGYRWGLERKRALLEQERRVPQHGARGGRSRGKHERQLGARRQAASPAA